MARAVAQMVVMINVTIFAVSLYSPTFASELRMISYSMGDFIRVVMEGVGLAWFI